MAHQAVAFRKRQARHSVAVTGRRMPEVQEIAAQNYYRPTDPAILARHSDLFPKVATFTTDDTFGAWRDLQRERFGDNGVSDQIYKPGQ